MKKPLKVFIILSPILIFLLVWGLSFGKCEILTLMHGDEFLDLYSVNEILGKQKFLKVLEYSDNSARVYYVAKDDSMANILSFIKNGDNWEYNKWERCVWSLSGNADDIIWPYWWHFIYFNGWVSK